MTMISLSENLCITLNKMYIYRKMYILYVFALIYLSLLVERKKEIKVWLILANLKIFY